MKTKTYIIFIVMATAAILFIGCSDKSDTDQELTSAEGTTQTQAGGTAQTHDEEADHTHEGQGEGKTAQVTFRSDRFEIFLEHQFIVANEPVTFVTHVTDLVTLMPRRAGSVTFVLRRRSETPIEHIEPTPTRDGIYLPELTFPQPGPWTVSLFIPLEGKEHRIELPPFAVYASDAEVDQAPAPHEIVGISFLKEQQWQIPTRTEPVQKRKILDQEALVIPESAVVDEGGKPVAFVQVAGETFEERNLELGVRDYGIVRVLSGLSQGEYVVTKGAAAILLAESAGPDQQSHVHDDGTVHAVEEPGTHVHEDGTVHADDEGGNIIHMHEEEMEKYGIEVGTAGSGEIKVALTLSGEISFNENKLAHVVPKVSGIVREVVKDVGDKVSAGEIIAWLESSELGKAKVDYLAKLAEVNCCSIDYIRTQEIYENTLEFLEVLKTSPSLETLRRTNTKAMGNYRSQLVSSYAELVFTEETYLREKSLFEGKITSEEDYLKAQNAFKKADALYSAALDNVEFEVKRNYQEANRDRQVKQMDAKSAERNLYVLGLTVEDVKYLEDLSKAQSLLTEEDDCEDPDCLICLAKEAELARLDIDLEELRQANEKLAWYPIRAPFDGEVIEKHIALGEVLKDDAEIFLIADLSTVWVNLQVYQKDLLLIRVGQQVCLEARPCLPETHGIIDFVGPVLGAQTRTALARVVLPNPNGDIRPGFFVNADITIKIVQTEVMVEKNNIQYLDDYPCVFVLADDGFESRFVTLGDSDGRYVAVTAGLAAGEIIATANSFLLKSELKKGSGDVHVLADGSVHIH